MARREKPPGFQALLLRIGIGTIAVCAIIVTTVLLVRRDDAPSASAPPVAKTEPSVPATATAPGADPIGTTPVAPKADTPPLAIAANNPPATAPANPPATTPATTGPIPVPNLTLPPVDDPPKIPAPTSPAEQDKRILAYLSTLRVSGIRPAGADSKVLMNDRVYKLNDVVDYSLGLKLTAVAVQRLEFVDERGVGYVKQF